jgi:integrase
MARVTERLTVRTIQGLKARGMHADGGGLYLRVGPTGSKSWVFRYVANGRQHDMGLGPFPDITLQMARERAQTHRRARLDGNDPLADKRAVRAAERLATAKVMNFKECADAYVASHSAGWRDVRTVGQWQQSLTAYVFPILGDLPVQAIDTGLVMKAIEPLWTTKTTTASRVRQRIESVLDYAAARGYRSGDNPARWRGHLDNLLPKRSKVARVVHHPALPYGEIAGFITELRRRDSASARALEFSILTASRRAEVLGARWSEINMAERLWIIPAERMKAAREHRVPLSVGAMAVLRQMEHMSTSAYVFPGQGGMKPLGEVAIWRLLRTMGRGELTMHGMRSTFRDWAAERTNFPREVAEISLAHAVGDATERAYQRGDLMQKRASLMQAWAKFCDSPAASGEKVVAIGGAR